MRYILGDARQMPELADRSVHLVVTSPPYWQLKDYGVEGQIGMGQSYEDYLAGLDAVWSQCDRVLHPGCRVVVNIGDQYLRAETYGRYRVLPIREAILRQFEARGFDYMGAIIWRKVTTMHSSGGGAVMGSFPHPRNGILKLDYEFVLVLKKSGKSSKVDAERKAASALTNEEWGRYFAGHWEFPGVRQKDHHAAFPLELPHRAIRMFSFVGETVLDPFAGTGTTLRAAEACGRNGVGYEVSPAFAQGWEVEAREGYSPSPSQSPAPFFGSAVTLDQVGRERRPTCKVTQVTGPVSFETDAGDVVLEGVTGDDATPLRRLIERKRVVVERTDTGRAFVWLENRTFVNARLVREGVLRVEDADFPRAAWFRALVARRPISRPA